RFGRGNLARGRGLRGIRAGCLAMPAAVRLARPGGIRALHAPREGKRELSHWSPAAGGGKKSTSAVRAAAHAGGRRAQAAALSTCSWLESRRVRISSVLVTRTQVQPVSLQTRSSPAPGAP